ncbi:MAG: asparagine synthase (glutamine-hydrolyzing) [Gemmatimonadota bacterium]|nr:asparagine synthase (glutamine-hydrolyzing) [Gemmatimonadota bacterium]MDE2872449.1 asparagine synthase (glutamine-hydrolyzing) [Gemmatimonadota bacterium]
MCGIAAILSRDGPVDAVALRRATRALRHRGPDAERTWVSPSGRAGLGHTLLVINDPEGHQPIASEDGRLHIVVNGQFYDFARIRAELESRGHRFRTRSDSEIALHLYEDLGAGCLERLRGQFAFVIWDEETGRLFAARDRFGLKPLFYAEHAGALYLASEAKALFAAGVPRAWDEPGVYHWLLACPDERRSLFAGIRQVPPGHVLLARNGSLRLERYWDLPVPARRRRSPRASPAPAGPTPTFPSAVERTRELTEEAVRLRMVAGVPVGCLLSGGLDSSAVLGVAAGCQDGPVAAFTVGFERREFDESAGAREAAAAAGADHTVVTLSDADLADHFADAVRHAETLQYNTHGAARYLLSRGVREAGYRSVLAGEGADEAFFGYEFLRAAAGASRGGFGPGKLLRILSGLLRSPRRHHPALAAVSPWLARLALLLPAAPSLFTRLSGGIGLIRSVCSPDFLRGFDGYDPYRTYYRRCKKAAALSRREPSRRLLHLWLHSIFANYHMAADRLDMAHGVEVRLPFLDHHLFEYLNSLPLEVLTGHPREKHLLREAMRPHIPDPVYDRVKRPFMAPSAVGTDGPLHDFLQDTLRGEALRAVPFVDAAAVGGVLDGLPGLAEGDRPSMDSLLLMLASVAVLQGRLDA